MARSQMAPRSGISEASGRWSAREAQSGKRCRRERSDKVPMDRRPRQDDARRGPAELDRSSHEATSGVAMWADVTRPNRPSYNTSAKSRRLRRRQLPAGFAEGHRELCQIDQASRHADLARDRLAPFLENSQSAAPRHLAPAPLAPAHRPPPPPVPHRSSLGPRGASRARRSRGVGRLEPLVGRLRAEPRALAGPELETRNHTSLLIRPLELKCPRTMCVLTRSVLFDVGPPRAHAFDCWLASMPPAT